jgi:class 3 adenylate cyclase
MERRLAAIVCADVAGYSRMMGADEAGTHAAFKAHRSAIYPIILNHGGRLVKNTGDGFLLEFPSIVGAIESAIAMQALMANHLPADRVMQFRMGIHMGDVIADEDEVFGDDVNIAVRLEAVAAPGGVAVSAKAYICRNRMFLQRDQSVRRVFHGVPIVNPICGRLIENRAMLLLDVGFVQTDLWNGDRPAAVASCA